MMRTRQSILWLWISLMVSCQMIAPVQGGPEPICRICGAGSQVVAVAAGPDTTCAELQQLGMNGDIPKVICDALPVSLAGVCACQTPRPSRAPSPKPSTAEPTASEAPSPEPSTTAPSSAPSPAPSVVKLTTVSTQVPTAVPTKGPTKGPTQLPTKGPTKGPTTVPTQLPTKGPSTTDAPATLEPTDVCSSMMGSCLADVNCCGGLVCKGATFCDRAFRQRAPKDAFSEAAFRFEDSLNLRARGAGRRRNLKGSSPSSSSSSNNDYKKSHMRGEVNTAPAVAMA